MDNTEKRIEFVKLLRKLRRAGEKPGDTILRALRLLLTSQYRRSARKKISAEHAQ